MEPPTVSIITVCLNDRAGLARTISSVARQTFTDHELVVVDGGSVDGSMDVVRANGPIVTDWVSERDAGIYDAQNKGLDRARGEWVIFLNSGDALASDDALARLFERANGEDVLYGDVVWEERDGRRRLDVQPDVLTLGFFMRTNLPHQATAVRRALLERLGRYDTAFRIAADYEFWLRSIVVHGAKTRHVPVPFAVQLNGGLSTRPESFAALRTERKLAREKALSPLLLEQWAAQLKAERGPILHFARTAFRPAARRLRRLSRVLRGKPDAED